MDSEMVPLGSAADIILVDDDDMEHLILKSYIQKFNLKNQLISFYSGEAFLNYMESLKQQQKVIPSLVLLDLRMPIMDGWEVLKNFRKSYSLGQDPRVVIFTSSDAPSEIQQAHSMGADFQTKPVGKSEFDEFFKRLLK